jgi:hypothetical protein
MPTVLATPIGLQHAQPQPQPVPFDGAGVVTALVLAGDPTPAQPTAAAPSAEADTSALAFADDDAELQAALLASMTDSSAAEADPSTLNPSGPLFAQFERPPLVSRAELLDGAATSQLRANEDAASALQLLGRQGARLVRIRGDGHCMFRALAAGLVLAVREMPPAEARSVGAWLRARLARPAESCTNSASDEQPAGVPDPLVVDASDSITSASAAPPNAPAADEPLDLLGALHDGSLPSFAADALLSALAQERSSNELVASMRRAACEYMRVHAARFRECEAALGVSFERYLSDMELLVPRDGAPRYGGAVELVALAEHLACAVNVYDTEALKTISGAGCAAFAPPSYQFTHAEAAVDALSDEVCVGESCSPIDESWVVVDAQPSQPLRAVALSLLRTGLHYHLLASVPRQPGSMS